VSEFSDVHNLAFDIGRRLDSLPPTTALGLLRGFDKAIAVAERHTTDKGEAWLTKDALEHIYHAEDHVSAASAALDDLGDEIDDDGLPHTDHAACRLLFAIAKREGM